MSEIAFTLSIEDCARCRGDGHEDLEFHAFLFPVRVEEYVFSHWTICPETGDPILLTMVDPATA